MKTYKCENCGKEYKSRSSLYPLYNQNEKYFQKLCKNCFIKLINNQYEKEQKNENI